MSRKVTCFQAWGEGMKTAGLSESWSLKNRRLMLFWKGYLEAIYLISHLVLCP